MEKIKSKITIANIIFVMACGFLAFYGLYYNSLSNVWVMVATIAFLLFPSFYVGRLRFDINFCFLMETFFVKAMLDQHTGRAWMVPTTMAMPMLTYLFGKLLVAEKADVKNADETGKVQFTKTYIAMGALSLGTLVLGLINWRLTSKSPVRIFGYYSVAFMGDTFYTNNLTYYFNFIFAGSFVVAALVWLFYKLTDKHEGFVKARPFILAGLFVIGLVGFVIKYVRTERFLAFKEGVYLIVTKHWGNFGLDLTYNNSTSNMWLDYGRDYGILVFVTLFIFFILTLKDAIKLALNKHVNIFCKALLLAAYIGLNIYYFVEAFAYQFAYLWYLGLIVCGIISEVSHNELYNTNRKLS